MDIIELNNTYKSELLLSLKNDKMRIFYKDYALYMNDIILFLKFINTPYLIEYLFIYHLIYLQFYYLKVLHLQQDLYNKYSFVSRMVLLLKIL